MEKFTQEEILLQREEVIKLLRDTNRKGIENLINFLDKSNYFFCWGSYKHHKYSGGLAEHSLQVCKIALEENNKKCKTDSIIIASLLHDICKVKYDFPKECNYYGHGTKSIQILEDYLNFKLTDEERRAIRFHLGKRSNIKNKETAIEFNKAKNENLWFLIHIGDCISCGNYPKQLYPLVKTVIILINK